MSKYAGARNIKLSKERMYEIIRNPLITEKSTIISEYNQVSFRVPLTATKPEIRAAVEGLFEVDGRHPDWHLPFVRNLLYRADGEEVVNNPAPFSKTGLVSALLAVLCAFETVV